MPYLETFTLPTEDAEWEFFMKQKSRAYSDYYPFQIFPAKQLTSLTFAPITLLYGDNGTGKSTLLNIIAEALHVKRRSLYNRSSFFEAYAALCTATHRPLPEGSAIITSDEVFDAMLNTRALNQGIDAKREDMFNDYLDHKFGTFHYHDLTDYDELKTVLEVRRKTQSRFVREHLAANAREWSNGESAMTYFDQVLQDNQLYLLDEPENSLSPQHQQQLTGRLADQARFFGCQFVIATHSPFLLALPGAKLYDLETTPVTTPRWQDLPAIRTYADFFAAHRDELN